MGLFFDCKTTFIDMICIGSHSLLLLDVELHALRSFETLRKGKKSLASMEKISSETTTLTVNVSPVKGIIIVVYLQESGFCVNMICNFNFS